MRNNGPDPNPYSNNSEKLNEILDIAPGTTIEYKPHHSSMKDRSTFRNARAYKLVATGEQEGGDSAPTSPVSSPAQAPSIPSSPEVEA